MQTIVASNYVKVVLPNRLCAKAGEIAIYYVDILMSTYQENTDDAGSNFKSKPF